MKVLLVHNAYKQRGGEDEVFAAEGRLLEEYGHNVVRYTVHNDDVEGMGQLRLAARTIFSRESYQEVRKIIRRERPDLMHVHNTLPLISPSAYFAANAEHVPVVQTLHNYRLLCPNALLFREGQPCEDCLGRTVAWPAVVHACYRGSRPATAAVTTMLAIHRGAGTWKRLVKIYIAVSNFERQKLISGGIPPERIAVKPNVVHPAPLPGTGRGGYAMFVGRLSAEKGIPTLLSAWRKLGSMLPLRIVGDGPLATIVERATMEIPGVTWLGSKSIQEVHALLRNAACLILPSECYETFGRVAAEAFAAGTPVIAADIGAIAELVDEGRTGFRFQPGDADDLARQVRRLVVDPALLAWMRRAARAEFLTKYSAEVNLRVLETIYRRACATRDASRPAPWRTERRVAAAELAEEIAERG